MFKLPYLNIHQLDHTDPPCNCILADILFRNLGMDTVFHNTSLFFRSHILQSKISFYIGYMFKNHPLKA